MQTRPGEGLRGSTLRAGRRRSVHPDPWAALCRQDSLVQTPWVRLRLGLFLLSSGLCPTALRMLAYAQLGPGGPSFALWMLILFF